MPQMDSTLLLSVFVAVEGAHAFSAFMPSYFTVKKFAHSGDDLERLRSGYRPAVVFNLAIGGVVSLLVKDVLPLIMSLIVVVFMMALYERAIAEAAPEEIGGGQATLTLQCPFCRNDFETKV